MKMVTFVEISIFFEFVREVHRVFWGVGPVVSCVGVGCNLVGWSGWSWMPNSFLFFCLALILVDFYVYRSCLSIFEFCCCE